MTTITVSDEAQQFRIAIEGRLAGEIVREVRERWQAALLETSPRQFTVDISQLIGYDSSGLKLLREMHRHGTNIAARNSRALAFLGEISSAELTGPTLVYRAERSAPDSRGKAQVRPINQSRAASAGK